MVEAELSPEAEAQAEVTRRKLVAAEVAALLLLRRRARAQLRSQPSPDAVEHSIASLLYEIRRKARAAGLNRLRAELELNVGSVSGSVAYDEARARMTARGYTRALFSYAAKSEADTATQAFKTGTKRAAFKLETAAATEVADAFNHERDKAARRVALESGIVLWKVWDATLDKRTCPTCQQMHGRSVPASEDFSEGRPGGVHPRCRCVELILTIDQVDFGRNL